MDLRANTAVDVLIGPFVDDTNGNTTEEALTIEDEHVLLSKLGQALTAKADTNNAAHDDMGYYNCPLGAGDVGSEGNLVLVVHMSGALPVRHEYNVLSEAAWDSLYVEKDTGFMDVNVKAISEDETAANNAEAFFDGTGYAGTNNVIPTVTALTGHTAQTGDSYAIVNGVSGLVSIQSDIDDILVDTGTTIPATLTDMSGATFVTGTDSLEAIRNRGDAEWVTGAGGSAPTVGEISDAVWDEAKAGHVAAGSFGEEVQAHSLSSEVATAQSDLDTITGADGVTLATAQGNYAPNVVVPPTRAELTTDTNSIITQVNANETKIDTMQGNVTDILGDTNELQGDWVNTGRLDTILDTIAGDVVNIDGDAMRGTDGANTTVPDAAGVAPTAAEIKTAMEADNSDLDYLVTDLINAKKINLTTGVSTQYSDAGGSLGTVTGAYGDDGTDVSRPRQVIAK